MRCDVCGVRCEVCGVRCELKDDLKLCQQIMPANYAIIICRHNEKAKMHIVHPSFVILRLTESAESVS